MSAQFWFGKIQFYRWIVLIIAQKCECPYCHRTVHLKMVKIINFILCIFYHDKNKWLLRTSKIDSYPCVGISEFITFILFKTQPITLLILLK